MTGLALAVYASVCWGTADFIGGVSTRDKPVTVVVFLTQGSGLALLFVALLITRPELPEASHVLSGAVAGTVGAIGIVALYRGLAAGPMAIVAAISATGVLIPVVAGLLTGDQPTVTQDIGMALALIGVIVAAQRAERNDSRVPHTAGVRLAFLAAIGFGLALVALRAASEHGPLWGAFVMRATTTALFAGAMFRGSFRAVDLTRSSGLLALAGILDAGAVALFATATQRSLLSIVSAVAATFPIMTIVLARIILREKLNPWQSLGVAAALTGVVLVAAG